MADLVSFEETPETKKVFIDLVNRINRITTSDTKPITDAIRSGFEQNFERESAGGSAWAALAPSTVLDRQKHGYGGAHKILERTGSYMNSFQGGGDHVETVETDGSGATIEVGSRHRLSAFHESGTSRMPARPAAVLSQDAERRVFKEIEDLFARLLGE